MQGVSYPTPRNNPRRQELILPAGVHRQLLIFRKGLWTVSALCASLLFVVHAIPTDRLIAPAKRHEIISLISACCIMMRTG